jgi:hypothetical protein
MTDDSTSDSSASRRLAARAVDSVMILCRRGNRLAAGVLMITTAISVAGFFLGYAALSGGMQSVWVVLGGFFAIVAIGSVIAAMLALRSVTRSSDDLITEVQTLIAGDTRTEQVVIETIEVSEASQDESVVVLSRQFSNLQTELGADGRRFPAVTAALTAIAKFPAFLLSAAMISLVFAVLSLLFLIGLAL